MMKIYTIGFTKKSAETFFKLLKDHDIHCLVDIRLKPDGQLSGFAKKNDLKFFLRKLNDCDYVHLPRLAPAEEILSAYRKDHNWGKYEIAFESLMDQRGIPETLDRTLFEEKSCCLLCSEDTPEKCHRRLVAERLGRIWGDLEIIHI
jgi:uncharacterized protein (DUF488 family)